MACSNDTNHVKKSEPSEESWNDDVMETLLEYYVRKMADIFPNLKRDELSKLSNAIIRSLNQ